MFVNIYHIHGWYGFVNPPYLAKCLVSFRRSIYITGTSMDTENDVFLNVSPLKYGHFGYLC